MFNLSLHGVAVVTLHPDGTVVLGADRLPESAALLLWEFYGRNMFLTYSEEDVPRVMVRLDGQEIRYLNGYVPDADAVDWWATVARQAPFAPLIGESGIGD